MALKELEDLKMVESRVAEDLDDFTARGPATLFVLSFLLQKGV